MKTITVGLIVGAMLLGPGRVGAQSPTTDSLPPLNCPEVARIARDTSDDVTRERMYATLALCPKEAGAVYVDAWNNATLSPALMDALTDASEFMRGPQVLQAVLTVAASPARSDLARLLALRVALRYVSQGAVLPAREIVASGKFSVLAYSPGGIGNWRDLPPGEHDRADVLQALADLAARGDGGLVTEVAQKARAELAYTYPSDTPLRPGALSAHWDCKGSLALANRGDVSIALRVVDSSGATLAQLSLRPGAGTGPKGYGIAVYSPGPLTLYMGTQLLQRLGCPAPTSGSAKRG